MIAEPSERVWAALLDPDAVTAWLPPDGMTGRLEHFDARPGGGYRMVLTYDDPSASSGKTSADSDTVDVRFVEITPGRKLAQAVDFVSDDPAFSGTMTMVWRLDRVAGGTRVDICAHDVPDGISADDHAAGLASSLSHLAAYLARGSRRGAS